MFPSYLLALLSAVGSTSQSTPNSAVTISGPISPKTVLETKEQIAKIEKSTGRVIFAVEDSPGGDADALLQLTEIVNSNADVLHVRGYCLSACAELVYLVNMPVMTDANTVIGFHGNALTFNELVRRFSLSGEFRCFEERARHFANLLKRRDADPAVGTNAMLERLHFYAAKEVPSRLSHCRNARFYSRFRLWLPNSDQLKKLLQVRLVGSVCADDKGCVTKYAKKNWGLHSGVVAGDRMIDSEAQ